MKNFKYQGHSIPVVVQADIESGDPIVKGEFAGVAVADAKNGESVEVQVTGVVEIAKKDAVAFDQGDKVYLEAGEGSDVNTQPEFGVAYKDAAAGDANILVWLKAGASSFDTF